MVPLIENKSSKNLKQSGFATLLIVLPVIFLLVGAVAGYMYANKNAGKAKNIVQTLDTKTLTQRIIDDVADQWGPLVVSSYGEFRVRGTVVSTEEAKTSPNGPGWYITLKKGTVQDRFFVSRDTDWYQGDYTKYGTWTRPNAEEIKAGDDLTIHTHGKLDDTTTKDTFFGFWVFKHTQ